eukprot:5298408-Prymnesium_polylepis.1
METESCLAPRAPKAGAWGKSGTQPQGQARSQSAITPQILRVQSHTTTCSRENDILELDLIIFVKQT